ncbi:MAG: heavy metal translocating P-type ATPase [Syntrophothermus sp.]
MQKYKVNNIDCPNCAAKIENNISKMREVRYVSLNFADSTMFIDTDNIEKVKKVIDQTEPGVEIIDISEKINAGRLHKADREKLRKEFLLLISVTAAYLAGIIFSDQIKSAFPGPALYILFIGVYLVSGWDVIFSAAKKIIKGSLFDEHFLMSLATIGAIAIGELHEAAGVMIFYQMGEFLQKLSLRRSRSSIKSLLEVKPSFANLKSDGSFTRVSPGEVKINDIIIVKAGEKIPLDGIITEGNSSVDTSPLTGEPVPRHVRTGDRVLAGFINSSGSLTVRVDKAFEDSSVSRMLELVENAAGKKAETEKFITKFSRYYTPAVVAIALAIAFIPPLLFHAAFTVWIYRALVILVISCPCALVISVPLGYFVGLGRSSQKGILIKGSNFLDLLSEVKTVIFDKTGTLTKGVFKVTEIVAYNGFKRDEILRFASEAEQRSNHPIAESIRKAYGSETPEGLIEEYHELAGYGIKARVNGRNILAGNDQLLHMENIAHSDCDLSRSVVHIAVDSKYAGYLIISDEMKEDSKDTVKYLRQAGIENIYMFTGDNRNVASEISEKLQLNGYFAELLPEDKVSTLEKIMRENPGNKIAFVGDGINDSPVIARADVGVAMGALGSDAAIETSDVVIMTDTPSKLGTAISIAKKTRRIVWQNIVFALAVKVFFITLGSFGVATMWEAVFGDMGVALIAILNSLRGLK